jgi:hypothetical protein
MAIEKINFHYPNGTLQSVFEGEAKTALELSANTSKKVDECIEVVNGVELIAIEATAVVDEMKIAQEQFVLENNDVRTQLLLDNEVLLDGLEASNTTFQNNVNTSKTTFETNMNNSLSQFQTDITGSKTTYETNMNNQLESFKTTTENALTTFQSEINTEKATFISTANETLTDMQTQANNIDTTVVNSVNSKIDAMNTNGTLSQIINDELLVEVNTNIDTLKSNANDLEINIKDFGAKCDGITDDTLAIKNAIASITTSGTIFIPKGSTIINDKIIISKNNITIKGTFGSKIKQSNSFKYCFEISSGVDNFTCHNLELEGSAIRSNYYPNENTALKFNGDNNNINIYNCIIHDFNVGIDTLGGSIANFKENYIYNMIQFDGTSEGSTITGGYGMELKCHINVNVYKNIIYADRHCVYLGGDSIPCEQVTVSENSLNGDTLFKYFQNTYEYVLKIRNGKDIKILNNYINNGYGGIIITNPTKGIVEIIGNVIQQTVSYAFTGVKNNSGIHIDSSTQTEPCEHVVVENNIVKNLPNMNGVFFDNVKFIEFRGNKIINCTRSGYFRPDPTLKDMTVLAENNFFNCTTGIQFLDLADGTAIKYVMFSGNMFASTMTVNPAIFGVNTKLNVQALKNRVIGVGGYEISAIGTIETTNNRFRYWNNSNVATFLTNYMPIVPTTESSEGVTGSFAIDMNFLYVCYATNTWKKIPLTALV